MTTITNPNVAAGARWLDQHYPGWEDRIDLERLKMSDCTQCVIGQLIGFFWGSETRKAITDLEPSLDVPPMGPENPSGPGPWETYTTWAALHGFALPEWKGTTTYWTLTQDWKALIIGRREVRG